MSNNTTIKCNNVSVFNKFNDVCCLNGTYLPESRCNGEIECEFGEDEFYCFNKEDLQYRSDAKIDLLYSEFINPNVILLNDYPSMSVSNKNKHNYYNDITKESQTLING